MDQREITKKTILLNNRGELNEAGYAKTMRFVYNRDQARSFPLRLKEWNFYQFSKGDHVVQMTIGHISYVCSVAATLLNIKTGERHQIGATRWFHVPKMDLNPEAISYVEFADKDFHMTFEASNKERILSFKGKNKKYHNVDILIAAKNDPTNEKMVIATPFKNKKQFYLNYKENYYEAKGHVIFDDINIDFDGATGLLDWGRGVWPYKHEWYWGSVSSRIDDVPFGLNIGWGFGDLSKATENTFFYNGKAYKLGVQEVKRDLDDYMSLWHIKDPEGKIEFTFTPIYDNYTENKMVIIDTHCHQIYGHFAGGVCTNDGRKKFDNVLGFVEHAVNRW